MRTKVNHTLSYIDSAGNTFRDMDACVTSEVRIIYDKFVRTDGDAKVNFINRWVEIYEALYALSDQCAAATSAAKRIKQEESLEGG